MARYRCFYQKHSTSQMRVSKVEARSAKYSAYSKPSKVDAALVISTIAGIIFSPHAANFIKPLSFADGSTVDLETITFHFTRLVLGVQLVLTGIQLPRKYFKKEWKPMALLLGPAMTLMWLLTSLLVWALVPRIHFIYALVLGATVTPTDPVLSSSIVKGHFADRYIPKGIRKLIVAESGANDGLGYPFIFLPLFLMKYAGVGDLRGQEGGVRKAVGLWFGETIGYTILLSVVYGAFAGWLLKIILKWATRWHYITREIFLVSSIALAVRVLQSDETCWIDWLTWPDGIALHRRNRGNDWKRRRTSLLCRGKCPRMGVSSTGLSSFVLTDNR